MLVTYMIATRNRKEEVLKTLLACRHQCYDDKEVLLVDDGSTDGTARAVEEGFPEVRLLCNERPLGSVGSRNLILDRAAGDVLIGFDDDSRFIKPDATAIVVERFRREADLGLIDFQDIGPEHPERIEDGPGRMRGEWHTASFGAGRFALRRTVLARTGTYAPFFWHAYEEPDLAMRIWDAGYRCVKWNDILVWHEFSGVNRDERRTHLFHARNELLSVWMRAPARYVLWMTAFRMASQLRYSIKRGWWRSEPWVWMAAARLAHLAWVNRRPVRPVTYRRCLRLSRARIADPVEAWALGY